MMHTVHDTLNDLDRGTPLWFTASGWLVPAGILTQFLLAGRALFAGSDFPDERRARTDGYELFVGNAAYFFAYPSADTRVAVVVQGQ